MSHSVSEEAAQSQEEDLANNTSLQAVQNRNKTIGVSPDYRLDPVYGGGH